MPAITGPSDERLFEAADRIYDQAGPDGYRTVGFYRDRKTGFLAARHKPMISSHHQIISVCGTQFMEDGWPSARDALADLNMGIDQYHSAAATALIADADERSAAGIHLYFTGHSLGDSLAKALAYGVAARRGDGANAGSIRATGFCGFGARELIAALNTDVFDHALSWRTRPVTYYFAADPVSRIGTHTGETLVLPDAPFIPEILEKNQDRGAWIDRDNAWPLGLVIHNRFALRTVIYDHHGLRHVKRLTPRKLKWASELGDPANRTSDPRSLTDQLADNIGWLTDKQARRARVRETKADLKTFFTDLAETGDMLRRPRADKPTLRLFPSGADLAGGLAKFARQLENRLADHPLVDVVRDLQTGLNTIADQRTPVPDDRPARLDEDGSLGPATRRAAQSAMADLGPTMFDAAIALGRFAAFLRRHKPGKWATLATVVGDGHEAEALQRALGWLGPEIFAANWHDLAVSGRSDAVTASACRALLEKVSEGRLIAAYGRELGLF